MNDHQLSVNASSQEVDRYLELWVQAGGDLSQLKILQKEEQRYLQSLIDDGLLVTYKKQNDKETI